MSYFGFFEKDANPGIIFCQMWSSLKCGGRLVFVYTGRDGFSVCCVGLLIVNYQFLVSCPGGGITSEECGSQNQPA